MDEVYINVEELSGNYSKYNRDNADGIQTLEANRTGPAPSVMKRSWWKPAAVFLGLLSLLLLTGLITLVFLFTQGNSHWEMKMAQLQTSTDNLTRERDQLQTSNINLTRERDQLQTSNINLTRERDHCLQVTVGFSDSSYYISSSKKSWHESREDCLQRGADLVILDSTAELKFLRGFRRHTWVGLTDRETEGTWRWVDGTPLTTTSYWASSEPNGTPSRDEDCAEIKRFDSDKSLNDEQCNQKRFWVCEKKLAL